MSSALTGNQTVTRVVVPLLRALQSPLAFFLFLSMEVATGFHVWEHAQFLGNNI